MIHPWITRDVNSLIPLTLMETYKRQDLIKGFKTVRIIKIKLLSSSLIFAWYKKNLAIDQCEVQSDEKKEKKRLTTGPGGSVQIEHDLLEDKLPQSHSSSHLKTQSQIGLKLSSKMEKIYLSKLTYTKKPLEKQLEAKYSASVTNSPNNDLKSRSTVAPIKKQISNLKNKFSSSKRLSD